MTEADNKEKYLEDVELVQSLIKKYRDNHPPKIKAGEYKEKNMAFIYVLIVLVAFALGCMFISTGLGSGLLIITLAIFIYGLISGSIIIHETRMNEWVNDFVSHEDFEKMAVCDTEFKVMVNNYAKETKKDLTYSVLDQLIERYKYDMKEKNKKPPFDIAS
ncbi:TPA: hypothetical protein QHS83_004498 [Klebsiella pneumoniae subsp. pneumoniae]|uniref:hypothetical protein n=1 Tax=Escherichia coli TaxID=562 RepID=UPI000DE2D67C|nr:hypothetical protein [Escherichia coli]HDS2567767.1 hypothetical protein [Klebsiella pneumoniae subsp. pneumoniae]HDT1491316.1 hypothetical protein [Klebsiella pneumoniae subsp. pneumoniae]HDT2776626.1 hypothetical protein [Escherichia coli]HDT3847141.1 hypothetical protein [Escherichia coli]